MVRLLQLLLIVFSSGHASAERLIFSENCAGDTRTTISNAFGTTQNRAHAAYRRLNKPWRSWSAAEKQAYTLWFGDYQSDRLSRVQSVLDSVQSQLGNSSVRFAISCNTPYNFLTNSGCEAGDFAETLPNARFGQVMTLCGGFFNAHPVRGYNSQWGVLYHEMSHSAANTEDFTYSTIEARTLAQSAPYEAIDNADNYEYFLEYLAQANALGTDDEGFEPTDWFEDSDQTSTDFSTEEFP